MRITAPMPEQHFERLSEIVVHHQETSQHLIPDETVVAEHLP
nr:hypothetical protein [Ligilactobacillus ruminis]